MIEIQKLSKVYGREFSLQIEKLHISEGESFGLVGNNGAGKTTLFSLILDLIPPTAGEVQIRRIPVHQSEEWKKFTTAYLDESFLIQYLTPDEYFDFLAKLRGVSKAQLNRTLEYFKPFFKGEITGKRKYIRDLSKGNQKKTGIAGVFIGRPDLILLDEPFANLDPSSQILLKRLLNQWRADNPTTFLISSHNLEHITEVTDRIVLLHNGRVEKDLPVNESTLKELIDFFSQQIDHEIQDGY